MPSPVSRNTIKTLIANPTTRRIALRGAKRAVAAARNAQASSGRSKSAVAPREPASARQRSINPTVNPVIASVAKPWAEKLAASAAGRSVLQAISSVSTEALNTAPSHPASASWVATKPAYARKSPVKFVAPVPPPASQASPRKSAIKWPPDAR